MFEIEVNKIPCLIKNGQISKKEAVNRLAEFVYKNYPLFGLHKLSEDFREDIILDFLEKGKVVLDLYDEKVGSFFPYFFSQIKSLMNKHIKTNAKKITVEYTVSKEVRCNAAEDTQKYAPIKPICCAERRIPYAANKITPQELFDALKSKRTAKTKKERLIVIIILKYALFIDERTLLSVSKALNLNFETILKGTELCKKSLSKKIEKSERLRESRNKSYFYHNKYQSQIAMAEQKTSTDKRELDELKYRYYRHTKIWTAKNLIIQNHVSHMLTSNKTIAGILGICERQVRYYVTCAKADNFSEIKKLLEKF